MQRIAGAIFLSVMAVGLGAAEPAAAQVIASLGADHSSGSYGTGARITTSSASIGLRVRRKRVSAFASLPVVRVDAPGNVVSTGGLLGLPILVDPARPATRVRRGGIGDAVVGASVQLVEPRRHHVALAVTGSAKLPTASSARGLGTGKADFAVTMEAARPGKVTPFAALGYTVTGQPATYRLENVTTAKGGVALRVGRTSGVSLSFDHASRVTETTGDRQDVAVGLETNLSSRLSLGVQGSTGVSRSAPAASAGMRIGVRL
ncbi:transporter [Sphingomonas beigongshangi]|uniref:transporter n=1 Tax=Sphingomonas beigongshangi TaxID=2782540 RepID=UPI00193C00F6|nr:transporter [Sphingomonas beigongshangi]